MSIPAWAYVGAKVVCVRESRTFRSRYGRRCRMPQVGSVYTLRHVAVIGGVAGCWLEEIVNPKGDPTKGLNGESGFLLARFRPVITIEDDLKAHFAHLLDAPVRVSEEA